MQLKCSQVQKCSKNIGKTVHVTSVAQLQFCDTYNNTFCLPKENTNKIIFILESITMHMHTFPLA